MGELRTLKKAYPPSLAEYQYQPLKPDMLDLLIWAEQANIYLSNLILGDSWIILAKNYQKSLPEADIQHGVFELEQAITNGKS